MIADVLAALQRMGSHPPPAILVKPDDMSEAVRAATVLASVIPELKSEIEAARRDLDTLAKTRESIARERDELTEKGKALAADKLRLAALIDARQQSLLSAQDALGSQQQRAAELAKKATSLKDLISRLDSETAARAAAAAAAHATEVAAAADIEARAQAGHGAEMARLKPEIAFADTKGRVPLPAAGAILKTFGSPDDFGGIERGVSLATPAAATVSAPVDGSVIFAGAIPKLWATLDHRCGRRILCSACRNGSNQCSIRRVHTRGGTGRRNGRRVCPHGDGGRSWRGAAGSLYRVTQGRNCDRSGAVVGKVRHREGARMIRKAGYLGVGVVLGAAVAATAPQALLFVSPAAYAAAADTYRQLNLFGDVFDKIRNDYVEKPDESKMIEAAINGMLSSLDPHSSYMDAKSFRDMQVQTKGEFGGLGIEVTQEDGLLKVVTPIDDTPAAKAGVLSGDLITAIDDTPTQGLTLDQAVEKMRGSINSPVKLKIVRGPKKDVKDFTIVRDLIHVQSVRSHVQNDDIGYIRITQFTEQTADGLKAAMDKLHSEIPADKFKGYILDLRNNPGGLLDQSIDVVNSFVDRGEIVSTRGRTADETQRFDAKPGGDLSGGKPLVVLINGGSASASEIVSGALQDHKRATLIGTRSFGKGSVQTIMPLGENGALQAHDSALLHAVGPIDPGQGYRARHQGARGRAGRSQGQGRHEGRGLAQGPSRQRRRGYLCIPGLCPAEREGRQATHRRHRPVARGQAPRSGGEGRCGSGEERCARGSGDFSGADRPEPACSRQAELMRSTRTLELSAR